MSRIFESKRNIARVALVVISILVASGVLFDLFFVYKPSKNALGALATVSMDVVSICVLLIIAYSLCFEKGKLFKATKLFLGLLGATIWGLFWDFLTWASDGALVYGGWTYFFTIASLVGGAVCAFFMVLYLSSYMDEMYGITEVYKGARICAILNVIDFVFTLILGISNNAFIFTPDGHYETGVLYDLITIIPILTLIHMTAYAIRHIKLIGVHDMVAVIGYITIMITGALIETSYSIGTTYVGVTIADVYIFVMLQNKLLGRVKEQKEVLAVKVNEEKKNVEKWMLRSHTDELTGFYNRYAYEEDIKRLEDDKNRENFVYVSMDVNSLKIVNDTLGHEAGDELIIGASECMEKCFGAYGKLYRTGGDEFAALIFAEDIQLESIKKNIADITANWNGKYNDEVAISCGYVQQKEDESMSLHQIAVLADKRMYEDKNDYYQKKGIDRRGQQDAQAALSALYIKVLKINLTTDTFHIISMNFDEKTPDMGYSDNISKWFYGFGASGQVHPEDLAEYLDKTDIDFLSTYFKEKNPSLSFTYRRRYSDGYRETVMDIIPANDYTDESQNLFLYVRDIE